MRIRGRSSTTCSPAPIACSSSPEAATTNRHAYLQAGRATVAHCDILIAVWDGLPPRGRGGTGEIVELAIQRGTAIIHLPVEQGEGRILWSAFDPNVLTRTGHDVHVHRPFDSEHLGLLLTAHARPAARPPMSGVSTPEFQVRAAAAGARPARISAAAGADRTARLKTHHWREAKSAAAIDEEWQNFWPAAPTATASRRRSSCLQKAYGWADRMATYYAQTFRSGHIFNFVLAAIAVLLGLSAFALPASKLRWRWPRSCITLAIIINTAVGIARNGTGAGSIIASLPSAFARCAA